MAEFGHIASIGDNLCIDVWGAGPFLITVDKKQYRFEDSDRFGPALIKKNDELLANPYPGERSPFWRAHRLWVRQGRQTKDSGECVWREPKPTKVRKIGRSYMIVENGEEDGATIVLEPLTEVTSPTRDRT